MENQKITAVEWLKKEMLKPILSMKEIFEKAKEMEKQQIIDANRYGIDMVVDKKDFITGEQYYNETFNKNKNE